MKFEIYESSEGWHFKMIDGNSQMIIQSRPYITKYKAIDSISRLRNVFAENELRETKDLITINELK